MVNGTGIVRSNPIVYTTFVFLRARARDTIFRVCPGTVLMRTDYGYYDNEYRVI